MNIIFAHDHKLRYINGNYYTLGGLSDSVTSRYTSLFGEVTIICRAIERQLFDKNIFEIQNPNVHIEAIHSSSLIISDEDKERIKRLVKGADAVIVRLPSFIGEIVFKYAKLYGKPILSEVVTCPWDSLWNHGLRGKIVAPYMWWRTRLSIMKSDYVVYVTQEFLQRRYPTRGIQIGCSDVELKTFDSEITQKRLQKIETYKDTPLVLGTLAALDTKFKGQQFVIKALSELRQKGILYKYRLAGGGSADYLKSVTKKYHVEDIVEFSGIISHDDIFRWIDAIDLYIQPSQQEGLPRALIEAMSRACPAVGSTAGGIPELLDKECIFRRGDSKGIEKILENIDNNYLKKYTIQNYKRSLEYEKSKLDKKRIDFYRQFYNYIKCGR